MLYVFTSEDDEDGDGRTLGVRPAVSLSRMSRVKCQQCGENFYDPDRYGMCYVCSMQDQGKKLCPECEEAYFDPSRFELCYNCWLDKKDEEGDPDGDVST
jgi:hypothetical protein